MSYPEILFPKGISNILNEKEFSKPIAPTQPTLPIEESGSLIFKNYFFRFRNAYLFF